MSVTRVYRWSCWETFWHPTQFRRVANFRSKCTRFDGSALFTSSTTNFPNARFEPGHEPDGMVLNRCSYWLSERFNLRCRFEETSHAGIICMIFHQVLCCPSEHETSSMGECLLANPHIAMLDESTQSTVTELTSAMVHETVLAILKNQESRGIPVVNSPRNFMFDILVNQHWPQWLTKHSKQAPKDIQTSNFQQNMWNGYLMLGFVLANIPWNLRSNHSLQWLDKPWQSDQVLLYARNLSNICGREFALTVDAIRKQSTSWNEFSLAWDWWRSTNKRPITSVTEYYTDWKLALREVQLTSHEIN
jgi:hypothetical protein